MRLLLLLTAVLIWSAVSFGQSTGFEVVKLSESVYAAIRNEPPA